VALEPWSLDPGQAALHLGELTHLPLKLGEPLRLGL
jgi:hypothetical protein